MYYENKFHSKVKIEYEYFFMLRTRQKSDYLNNKYSYLDKYRNNRVVRSI